MLKYFDKYEKIDKIIVTENGSAFPDVVENGRIHDHERKKILPRLCSPNAKGEERGCQRSGLFSVGR